MHRKSAYFLFVAVLTVLVVGIVMLFSVSAFAQGTKGDVYLYVKRQAVWIGIGLVLCTVGGLIDYHFWRKTWWVWFGLAIVLLALCFAPPPIGVLKHGSRRWIGIGPLQMQPSELGRLATIFFLGWWFSRYEKISGNWLYGFVYPLLIIAPLMGLICREVDLGTTVLIGATTFIVMFVAGTNSFLLGGTSLVGLGGILFIAMQMPERVARLKAFLHPELAHDTAGLQQFQSLIAFGSGGIQGLGLGNGREKMLYLPFAHTDFIFPILGEELGLRFTLLVVFLFVVIIVCGMMIALHAKDRLGLLLACGIISILGLQAAINMGVTTSLLPNKGLPLPFISYGGSNLVACLFSVGILLNIYRQGILEPANKKRHALQVRMTPRI
jgi:cell division protein FtsW